MSLARLRKLEVPITWGTALVCLDHAIADVTEVIDFAAERWTEELDCADVDSVKAIALSGPDETDSVRKILRRLADREDPDYGLRVLRLYIMTDKLQEILNDKQLSTMVKARELAGQFGLVSRVQLHLPRSTEPVFLDGIVESGSEYLEKLNTWLEDEKRFLGSLDPSR